VAEDASNTDTAHTRNRIRHELLPRLAEFNPQIAEASFARLATIARDEEKLVEQELGRLLPSAGPAWAAGARRRARVSTRPVKAAWDGAGAAARVGARVGDGRVLRAAAKQLRCGLNFEQTERLMAMCDRKGRGKEQLAAELRAERTARELRLVREAAVLRGM